MEKAFPGWTIMEGAGGGYIAFRAVLVPLGRGLSNVRCGATLAELYEHLEQERCPQAMRASGRRLGGKVSPPTSRR
ncbi:hypothetical protein E1295_16465 [Nonomuraea mesophila]|uniref:Uncharacterized protein n=1 Tax=Nonomuraea mesophila TaxID=2530382 RepID=A0A4R5FLQ3_9ACTN|nr:hypothetical protein [Nonomuraea mesophila]TDE53607.1 hypothetical protein E1295_16465 [Nonomuraea mesophila]